MSNTKILNYKFIFTETLLATCEDMKYSVCTQYEADSLTFLNAHINSKFINSNINSKQWCSESVKQKLMLAF